MGFADGVDHNDKGWILFNKYDQAQRRKLFPAEVFKHPAKANLNMLMALTEYLTKPGDTILDPFGGTGSMLVAALVGRNVVLIELDDRCYDLILRTIGNWTAQPSANLASMIALQGDCRLRLPFPCDCVITSPPYSTVLGGHSLDGLAHRVADAYSYARGSNLNLSRLNPFLFVQAMRTVFVKLAESVKSGGAVVTITKDMARGRERVYLSEGLIRYATEAGLKLAEWYKWEPASTSAPRKAENLNILDEDLIIFRKP